MKNNKERKKEIGVHVTNITRVHGYLKRLLCLIHDRRKWHQRIGQKQEKKLLYCKR